MKPTYEELEIRLAKTEEALAKTQDLLRIALEEIEKLKEKINRNSKNSSKPPSGDQKSNTSPDPKEKRKKREGKARPLYPKDKIDHHIQCTLENCPHCGSNEVQLSHQTPEILQQAELPEVKAIITEYQLLKYDCQTCGKNSAAGLPSGVPDSAFGPKLMGLLVTLTGVFHLAKREAVQLLKELYGVDMGIGSVPNIEERVADALEPIYRRIHGFVMESKMCKHFDETGWRNQGKRHYVWLASCEMATFYMIDRSRSSEAFHKLLIVNPDDISVVTDRYAVYSIFKSHQYCLAHLIRDFRKFAERDGPDKEIGQAIEKGLQIVCHIHKKYRDKKISLTQRNRSLGHHKRKVENFLEDGFANGSEELFKLCEHLLDNLEHLWAFTKKSDMEPTNNLAERDLRKLVIWRKKSYGTRSERGKRFVERITTVSQTLKRQGKSILKFFQDVVVHFYANLMPPTLSEALGF